MGANDKRRWLLVVGVGGFLFAQPAAAQPVTAGAAAARDAGALMNKKKYLEACARFAESQKLEPRPTTELALAQCWVKADRPLAAIAAYRELGKIAAYAFSAKSAIAVLEKRLGRVAVAVAPQSPEPEILRDGAPLSPEERAGPVYVEPGQHTVGAAAPGKKRWTTTVALKPGETATVAVPVLEDDVSAIAAQSTDLVALRNQGNAEWTEGLGFVTPEPTPPPPPPPRLLVFPVARNEKVGASFIDFGGGATNYSLPVQAVWAPTLNVAIGAEFRRARGYLAPWFDFSVAGSFAATHFVGGGLRFGIDVHPRRWSWLGVGPYFGWDLLGAITQSDTPIDVQGDTSITTFDHGPEIGFFHVHLRTRESEPDRPVFDAEMKIAEVVSVGSAANTGTPLSIPQAAVGSRNATYAGAKLGVGGHVRFVGYVEGRLDSPHLAALLITPSLRAGGNLHIEF